MIPNERGDFVGKKGDNFRLREGFWEWELSLFPTRGACKLPLYCTQQSWLPMIRVSLHLCHTCLPWACWSDEQCRVNTHTVSILLEVVAGVWLICDSHKLYLYARGYHSIHHFCLFETRCWTCISHFSAAMKQLESDPDDEEELSSP